MTTREEQSREVAQYMSNYVNSFGGYEAFCDEMSKEHRTLQQNFTKLCIAWLKTLAKAEHFDPRNEASVQLARKIVEQFEDELYLPCI
jgi:hypothetical protein